jgi:beta-mannosidase
VPHHPRWKARVPRDSGSGYDFEDIRDFYLNALFGFDPVKLRSENAERYYAMSRAVSGEVMLRAYAEWRRADNPCSGALIWFYKDLWPGAGWGIIDSENRPKAVWHYLRRALAPRAVLITDEGQDGLKLHIINETESELEAEITVEMYRAGRTRLLYAEKKITVDKRGSTAVFADEVIGHFTDIAYNYRFGPPKHDVVIACLRCPKTGDVLGEDYFFPTGLALPEQRDPNIQHSAQFDADGGVQLTLQSDVFLQCVTLQATGARTLDNYFHLAPNVGKTIRFVPTEGALDKFKVSIDALNISESIVIRASRTTQ